LDYFFTGYEELLRQKKMEELTRTNKSMGKSYMDERLIDQMMKGRVFYYNINLEISNRDRAELAAKELLELDKYEQNQNLVTYTHEKEIKYDLRILFPISRILTKRIDKRL
jgi:hypothetical protein